MSRVRNISLVIIGMLLLVGGVLAVSVTQTATVTVLSGKINVYSPTQDKIYDERMVPINLTMSSEVNFFKYSDNMGKLTTSCRRCKKPAFKTLCRKCDEYGFSKIKRKPFDDGFHELTILAVFDLGDAYHYVNFTVDTKDPKITKTKPENGFNNGGFKVEILEANPKELTLHYGNSLVGFKEFDVEFEDTLIKSFAQTNSNGFGGGGSGGGTKNPNASSDSADCLPEERGRRECSFSINLTDYDGQEIKYWFNLSDILDNIVESKTKKINVDTTLPMINFFNYTQNGRRVTFLFDVTEINFDEINYMDFNDKMPRWRRLCSKLKDNVCEKRKSFRKGERNVSIRVIDDANNIVEIKNIIFNID